MAIVQTDIPITSESCDRMIQQIVAAYPFCRTEVIGTTAFQRPLRTLVIGNGPRKVIYSASHHANEWITSLVLLKFGEELAQAISENGVINGIEAKELADAATIYMVPMVDPDGVDLVTGAIPPGSVPYETARTLAEFYPNIPFPEGWKANLLGVDLNLQYPAGWLQAREIKFSQGFTRPGPRDYVGRAPLDQLESRALAGYTEYIDPALVLAYHTQGEVIYWQFRDYEVPGAQELGEQFAQVSGYELADTPFESSFAGYKDWFIQQFRKPGYTIEVGLGENPLPLEQFEQIYRDNIGILTIAALGGQPGGAAT
ncbi:MAG: M14 family metallocarboxypeptidase [Oscillospiraceae bacterium]|nr:M14 family metallocarboxypeptidase [Oscillospiraceae bacterium]